MTPTVTCSRSSHVPTAAAIRVGHALAEPTDLQPRTGNSGRAPTAAISAGVRGKRLNGVTLGEQNSEQQLLRSDVVVREGPT